MNARISDFWARSVQGILEAESLAAAQFAASELKDDAVPGGAAVDISSIDLVEALARSELDLAREPFRAYVLAVLVHMATWIRTWRNTRVDTPHGIAAAEGEEILEQRLADFCADQRSLLRDEDEETRSLMSVLVGSVCPPSGAFRVLMQLYQLEDSEIVRGCIVQGLLRVVLRGDSEDGCSMRTALTGVLADASREECRQRSNMRPIRRSKTRPPVRRVLVCRVLGSDAGQGVDPAVA